MTRKQELILIEIGLATLIASRRPRKYKKRKSKWSKERHIKFEKTMTKKWKRSKKSDESI